MQLGKGWEPLKAILTRMGRLGHFIGGLSSAVLVAAGVAGAIVLYFREILKIFENADVTKLNYALVVLSVVALISSGLALFYQRRYAGRKRLLRKAKSINSQSINNDRDFLAYAENNADCDKTLFELFLQDIAPKQLPQEPTVRSVMIIKENIQMGLDLTTDIFDRITDDRCAACVKIIDISHVKAKFSVGDLRVKTLMRDSKSRVERYQHDKRLDSVENNTAEECIFTVNNGHFPNELYVCDDLKIASNAGKYVNKRFEWYNDYNATIVCAIRNLRPDSIVPFVGLLCVDNMGGGLDTPRARQYIKLLAQRLSIMLYRMDLLQERLSESPLNRTSRDDGHLGTEARLER